MVTKTLNPLHFEDLEPHRFEDLVRDLIYDYRDWQSIEATGRGGSDEGFDIRAWERPYSGPVAAVPVDPEEELPEDQRPAGGNLWMVQCKREKSLGPKRVKEIVRECVKEEPVPYGFILVAPVNFSKSAYDAFRSELSAKGVMEFYLWGRGELEDMLFQPKNDRVLFAFFGISLVTRRRSQASQIKSRLATKNKLLRVFEGRFQNLYDSVLIRDVNDQHYPFADPYKDFDARPRWREYVAVELNPKGLVLSVRKHYAYLDRQAKEFDYTEAADLVPRRSRYNRHDTDVTKAETESRARDFWLHLPRARQSHLEILGVVFFDDIIAIDDKGDGVHDFPHVYVDYGPVGGPFGRTIEVIEICEGEHIYPERDGFARISAFPESFPKPSKGTVHEDRPLEVDSSRFKTIQRLGEVPDIFDSDGKYDYLQQRDFVRVMCFEGTLKDEKQYAEVTYRHQSKVRDYLAMGCVLSKEALERRIGRPIGNDETLTVLEFRSAGEWEVERLQRNE